MFEAGLIIGGGHHLPGEGDASFERRDPVSDVVVTRARAALPAEAEAACTAAAAAFEGWAGTPGAERAALLLAAADRMAATAGEVVEIAAGEVGSAEAWTRYNVEIAVAMLRQAAGLCTDPDLAEREVPGGDGSAAYRLARRPAGVVLGMAPWNAAVTLAVRAVAAPLACGNTVVLKASELCPKTHEWVARQIIGAGLPRGVLNYVATGPDRAAEVAEAMIGHPAIRRVSFTGSTRVGREIAQICARHLKPCLLELSGKCTLVVLDDADLDAAAEAAAHGAFFNQGQVCMSTERIVVDARVADAFLDRFVRLAQAQRAAGREAPLGELISPQAALRVQGMIEDALRRGARLLTGGEAFGRIVQPTILDNVSPDMAVYAEEVFGPVAAVIRVADAEEALSVANDTAFGLAAAVFGRDTGRALALLRQVECGIGHVNGSTVFDDPSMPFGGVKASGYGRFGGRDAIHEFTERQWLTVRGARP